ncbi:hypothetical protein C0993_005265 [Termitomyces sp. T159_Od127]|nr:hypothetical protein C0993_005265 [Termitomyces sp. T159_Od127]
MHEQALALMFSSTIKDVISNNNDHRDVALTLEYNHILDNLHILKTAFLDPEVLSPLQTTSANTTDSSTPLENPSLSYLYLTTSKTFEPFTSPETYLTTLPHSPSPAILGLTQSVVPPTFKIDPMSAHVNTLEREGVQVKKKYKPVALKTKPVTSSVSEEFRIEQKILGNLLANIPLLDPNPPPFQPTGCFIKERHQQFLKDHNTSFLTQAELNVLSNLMTKQNKVFTWDDTERGSVRTDFFPLVINPYYSPCSVD